MKKSTLILFASAALFFLISCSNQEQKKDTAASPESTLDNSVDEPISQQKIGRENYAVIWKWATDDVNLVSNNSAQISKELSELWKSDVIENTYYDTESKIDKLDHFPNIVFFLKAKDNSEAKSILNGLTVVKKGIATYKTHPVGKLWLDRKAEVINKKGISKSFATVWTTNKSIFQEKSADALLKKQNDTVIDLWNNGVLENIYFDIDGSHMANEKTDFVFFVNANTEQEAKHICNSLPFYKEGIATYEMHQAGVFWMGKYENN